MEETGCSWNCYGYRRKYRVSLFYLPGTDHRHTATMKRLFKYLRLGPLGEPLCTHSCTKGEELNGIVCQSWENMRDQHRHQEQMYSEIWRRGGWTNTMCFLTYWDLSWVEQEKRWKKRRDNSPFCSSGPWMCPSCSHWGEGVKTHLSAWISFHRGLACGKDSSSPFSCPFFLNAQI